MIPAASSGELGRAAGTCICPACQSTTREPAIEKFGKYERFACGTCGLQFWEPREMPDARWYEQMYGGRDQNVLPLEPGHKYFLAEPLAARGGSLLDIGCGTGNFLAAARDAGYRVTGIELDRNAARFAKDKLDLQKVFPLTIAEFSEQYPDERFDVVTFFEVLEHQAAPVEFLQEIRARVRADGLIALSVPNRERWMTGPDVLDYPPNHFLRWSVGSLRKFLSAQGFEIVSFREQPAGVAYTAQMINIALRTGITQPRPGEVSSSFRDLMQMTPDQADAILHVRPTTGRRAVQILGRIKHAMCFPLAVAVMPYVRLRAYKGTYLYCLARKRD
jgi:SAM-dependent methyltransferase